MPGVPAVTSPFVASFGDYNAGVFLTLRVDQITNMEEEPCVASSRFLNVLGYYAGLITIASSCLKFLAQRGALAVVTSTRTW